MLHIGIHIESQYVQVKFYLRVFTQHPQMICEQDHGIPF